MLEFTCGILVAIGIYLVFEKNILRRIFGIVVLSTAINLILLLSGRLDKIMPAFIGRASPASFSNPVPQALILTAIVIGFGLLAFLCTLVKVINHNE